MRKNLRNNEFSWHSFNPVIRIQTLFFYKKGNNDTRPRVEHIFKFNLIIDAKLLARVTCPYRTTSVGMKNSGHTFRNSSRTCNFTMLIFSGLKSGAIIIYIMATTTHEMRHKQEALCRARSRSSPFARPVDSIASFASTSQLQLLAIRMLKSILLIVRLGF